MYDVYIVLNLVLNVNFGNKPVIHYVRVYNKMLSSWKASISFMVNSFSLLKCGAVWLIYLLK